jgi:glutamate--cysteine ligase
MSLPHLLNSLGKSPEVLRALLRGIEKESLRVSKHGNLSNQPHPSRLGSALTHPSITTDFSEAQLELITGVHNSPERCLAELEKVHGFVFANLDNELLWPASMPCIVAADEHIPVGQYGTSNIGMAKTVYRRGLGVRYGRLMQTISGIHYNFSIPDQLWQALSINDQVAKTEAYFGLIRNFRRWSWLLLYAFGASPAICKSFTRGLPHNLSELDEGSHYLPYATSLRMGPLGYQSDAQTQLHISYNSVDAYTDSMVEALTTPYPAYAQAEVKDNHGEFHQLSTSIIQIENEFYGTIRPKRTIHKGERPVTALRSRGVEYVEVRCIDLNPFLRLGIDAEEIRFLDTFLLTCLLTDSPPDSVEESTRLTRNLLAVVERGRDPALVLETDPLSTQPLSTWANELLGACNDVAKLLDQANETSDYTAAVASQGAKVNNPNLTPSARSLAQMHDEQIPFFRFAMNQANAISEEFAAAPLTGATMQEMDDIAQTSHDTQREAEAADQVSFDEFLVDYLALPE